jgi:hypothetical protein
VKNSVSTCSRRSERRVSRYGRFHLWYPIDRRFGGYHIAGMLNSAKLFENGQKNFKDK